MTIQTRNPVGSDAVRYTATFAPDQIDRLKKLAAARRHSVSQVIRDLVDIALGTLMRDVLTQRLTQVIEEDWEHYPGDDNSFAREAYHLAEKFLAKNGLVIASWPCQEHYIKSSRDFAERVMARAITQSEAVAP